MKKSLRQKFRPWLIDHPTIYNTIKSIHRSYCSLTESIHSSPDFIIIGVDKGGTSSL